MASAVSSSVLTQPTLFPFKPHPHTLKPNPPPTLLPILLTPTPKTLSLRASRIPFSPGPIGYLDLSTQWNKAAAAISKWLEIYHNVLLIRVLMSWFPNLNWEKQPFPALRSLCDPYLSLFTKVLPPVFGLDVSPLLAFAVLQFVMSLLSGTPPVSA